MIVFDVSTLILLAKADILKIAIHGRKVIISKEVERESTCRDDFLDAKIIKELIKENRIKSAETADQPLFKRLQEDFVIDKGEASALVLAYNRKATLATDDGQAIKACKVLGIRFVTAIHFLLDMYRKGRINKEIALVKLERLKILGRYNVRIISDAIGRISGEVKKK